VSIGASRADLRIFGELNEVNMKAPHKRPNRSTNNIPELIAHLWAVYSEMSLDPALRGSAEHIRRAAVKLEEVQRLAWQVCQEELNGPTARRRARVRKPRKDDAEKAAEWLRAVPPASPLKQ
jgi:hypothetical protein